MQVSYDSSGIKVMARIQGCFFVMSHPARTTGRMSVHPGWFNSDTRASHENMEHRRHVGS